MKVVGSVLIAASGDLALHEEEVDVVGAGVGERVLVNDEGNGARGALASPDGPVRSVVVAIVDAVEPPTSRRGARYVDLTDVLGICRPRYFSATQVARSTRPIASGARPPQASCSPSSGRSRAPRWSRSTPERP